MSGAVYGGDEVGAVVFDIGTCTTKAGFAGEDSPKAVFPTEVGVRQDTGMDTGGEGASNSSNTYFVGRQGSAVPRRDVELKHMLQDSMIEDWTLFEELLNHTYKDELRVDYADRPVMFAEAPWNTATKRETLAEIMFEKYNVPALFLSKSAVLSAFAAGRSTALVIDSGANCTSCVPVYDGIVLTESIRRNKLAGDHLTEQYQRLLKKRGFDLVPAYQVKSKEVVGENEPAKWVKKTNLPAVTTSYHDFMVKGVVRDLQNSIARVSDQPFVASTLRNIPTTHYEFPNGFSSSFGLERYSIPEGLFNPDLYIMDPTGKLPDASKQPIPLLASDAPKSKILGHQGIINESIRSCDEDVRQTLWSSIVLAGANTLHSGYAERLHSEIVKIQLPGSKFKIIASPSSQERQYGTWIGGSILASLGSFQQMWFSRQEYDEGGKGLIAKKCA